LRTRAPFADGEHLARGLLREYLAEHEGVIHRSYIVSLAAIRRIEPAGKDSHCAVLDGGVRIPISRSGYQKVRDLIR
jgi:DNA-binding LytR/AlgR family response regulator